MKNYKKAIGNAIIMWIVGVSPVILPVIYCVICYIMCWDDRYQDILSSVSVAVGGILAIYVMKKEYNVDIKEYLRKPDLKILMLVIVIAIFYTLVVMYVVYKSTLNGEPEIDTLTMVQLILGSTANPFGEELTFRFGMLTLLFIAAKDSRFKTIFSIIIVSLAWMVVHFSGYIPRCLDITFVGIMLSLIYMKSKNIIYCIVLHVVLNAVTFVFVAFYPWFLEREYILYISLPLLLISAVALIYRLGKTDCGKFVLNAE